MVGLFVLVCVGVSACAPVVAVPAVQASTPTFDPAFYPIPETGLLYCYSILGQVACPAEGEIMFGQDANYIGDKLVYTDNGDGTLSDAITGLTWQRVQTDERLSQAGAAQACDALELAGYDDWRLPSIQELFSIADVSGLPGTAFFINGAFDLRYADPNGQYVDGMPFDLAGQSWSATSRLDEEQAYIYNFFNGDLRSYSTQENFFYRCVRGAAYGHNDLRDNGDGTLTDAASGLVWQQADSLYALNWGAALAYCENLDVAGFSDWRLPDIKELSSIAFAVAENGLFTSSAPDAHYWSATTRADTPGEAYSLCIGECTTLDGLQPGSEPKYGSAEEGMPGSENMVRCARGGARHAINGPYTVNSDTTNLVVDIAGAGQLLGVSADELLKALGSNQPGDPVVQKAAFTLGLDVEELRAALQAHTFEATPLPST